MNLETLYTLRLHSLNKNLSRNVRKEYKKEYKKLKIILKNEGVIK